METRVQINNSYIIRTDVLQGRPHIVVPVVMMVEGVHSGSHGPMLHRAEELGRSPDAWNGKPVTIFHPETEGQNVSANSPDIINTVVVGQVFNTHMDGNKLKAEAWLDIEKMEQISPEALAYVRAMRPLDVSVGMFTDEETTQGIFKGEQYNAIATNLRPDHLALLPGEEGACSWADGCGIRNNKNEDKKGGTMKQEDLIQTMKSLNKEGYSIISLVDNEQGLTELLSKIQGKLYSMDDGSKDHYLIDVFSNPNYFVYELRQRGTAESTLYKRDYSVNTDGSVEFAEATTEVIRKVEYVVMKKSPGLTRQRFSNNNVNKEVEIMSEEKKTPCCEDLVDELITNERTKFDDKDKEQLLTLEGTLLGKLIPEVEKVEADPKPEKAPEPVQVNAEDALKVLRESIKEPEDFFKILPAEMQDSMRSGLTLHEAQRAKMVKAITDNLKDVWSEDDLKAMDMETLSKVHKSIPETVDYSGNGSGTVQANAAGEEPLYPAGVEIDEKK